MFFSPEAYSQPFPAFRMALFTKIGSGWNLLTISARSSTLDLWLHPECAPAAMKENFMNFINLIYIEKIVSDQAGKSRDCCSWLVSIDLKCSIINMFNVDILLNWQYMQYVIWWPLILNFIIHSDQAAVFSDNSHAWSVCSWKDEHYQYRSQCCAYYHQIKGKLYEMSWKAMAQKMC